MADDDTAALRRPGGTDAAGSSPRRTTGVETVADAPVPTRKSARRASRASRRGVAAAYAAAVLAFGYAAVSIYWAAGGQGLLNTVGGTVEQVSRHGGAAAAALSGTAALAKVAAGLLALALVRPWGRRLPRRGLFGVAAVVGLLLVLYGGALEAIAALVLSGVIDAGGVDRVAVRWHVAVWDLWFLVWGTLTCVAVVSLRGQRQPPSGARPVTPGVDDPAEPAAG